MVAMAVTGRSHWGTFRVPLPLPATAEPFLLPWLELHPSADHHGEASTRHCFKLSQGSSPGAPKHGQPGMTAHLQ